MYTPWKSTPCAPHAVRAQAVHVHAAHKQEKQKTVHDIGLLVGGPGSYYSVTVVWTSFTETLTPLNGK
jgi:hypothetical protein